MTVMAMYFAYFAKPHEYPDGNEGADPSIGSNRSKQGQDGSY